MEADIGSSDLPDFRAGGSGHAARPVNRDCSITASVGSRALSRGTADPDRQPYHAAPGHWHAGRSQIGVCVNHGLKQVEKPVSYTDVNQMS